MKLSEIRVPYAARFRIRISSEQRVELSEIRVPYAARPRVRRREESVPSSAWNSQRFEFRTLRGPELGEEKNKFRAAERLA